ncbi:MAG: M20/M25/M40 family metallo-hydrolase, partial [Candidatus Binatia bacterium]
GRGALDMKNLAAMSLMTMLLLRRQGVALDRDVIFAAVADEEAGSNLGSLFLVENHPDLVRAEYVLTEVGGHTLHMGGRRFYPIQVSEKGICWFELVARGEPGHGSMPHPKNAVVRLARAVTALADTRLPQHNTPIVEKFLDAVAGAAPFPGNYVLPLLKNPTLAPAVLALLERIDPGQAIGLNAMLRNTTSPTRLAGGKKVNVIPSSAAVQVDGRVIPGRSIDSFLEEVRGVVGDDVEIRVLERHEGSVFESGTELFATIEEVLRGEDADATVIPFMIPGFTDSFAYGKLGATCYGFVPLRLPGDVAFTRLYHGHDERVPVDGFTWGVRVLHEVVKRFCEAPGAA